MRLFGVLEYKSSCWDIRRMRIHLQWKAKKNHFRFLQRTLIFRSQVWWNSIFRGQLPHPRYRVSFTFVFKRHLGGLKEEEIFKLSLFSTSKWCMTIGCTITYVLIENEPRWSEVHWPNFRCESKLWISIREQINLLWAH